MIGGHKTVIHGWPEISRLDFSRYTATPYFPSAADVLVSSGTLEDGAGMHLARRRSFYGDLSLYK